MLHRFVLGSCLACAATAAVVELTDADFEHTTQASTGQTTGRWVVFFQDLETRPWAALADELAQAAKHPGPLLNAGVNVATVDVKANPNLAKRFGVAAGPWRLFADRQMYIGKLKPGVSTDTMAEFVTGGYLKETVGQRVPEPQSWIESGTWHTVPCPTTA